MTQKNVFRTHRGIVGNVPEARYVRFDELVQNAHKPAPSCCDGRYVRFEELVSNARQQTPTDAGNGRHVRFEELEAQASGRAVTR